MVEDGRRLASMDFYDIITSFCRTKMLVVESFSSKDDSTIVNFFFSDVLLNALFGFSVAQIFSSRDHGGFESDVRHWRKNSNTGQFWPLKATIWNLTKQMIEIA